jgi:Domain of unknown function (DUF697)
VRRTLASLLVPLAIVATFGFGIIVLNQTFQLVDLADRLHPAFGSAVLITILVVFLIGIGLPLYVFLRLPKPLIPPQQTGGPEFERYREHLAQRLASNPLIKKKQLPGQAVSIEAALEQLDDIADRRIRDVASQVFLATAISQNGSVDALVVLGAQGKLVLDIATIYYQRPTLRDLVYLYANVAATAFIAGELDDIDVAEQMQPIVTAVLGSSVAAIPGMSAAASLFVNSVVTGTGNAYLTLRVGIVARQYCGHRKDGDRKSIRRSAAVQALPLLGSIVRDGAASVASAIWDRPKKFFSDLTDKMKFWNRSNAPGS